eukprot:scaffold1915_cov288-Prasinococcus_capsulatus_cf.AAC.1
MCRRAVRQQQPEEACPAVAAAALHARADAPWRVDVQWPGAHPGASVPAQQNRSAHQRARKPACHCRHACLLAKASEPAGSSSASGACSLGRWRVGLFTGDVDVPLTERGLLEALEGGRSVKHVDFDVVFTSRLTRAKSTAMIALTQNDHKKVRALAACSPSVPRAAAAWARTSLESCGVACLGRGANGRRGAAWRCGRCPSTCRAG